MKFTNLPKLWAPVLICLALLSVSAQTLKKPQPVPPIKAILNFFEKRPLVALDEGRHQNALTHKFILDLIRDPEFPQKVNDIVVEWGTSRYQDLMDKYINGEEVPFERLSPAWRETTQVYVWDNPVYRNFFAAVRALNQKLPKKYRLRVLLGDPPIDWSRVNSFEDWIRESPRDKFAADLIVREVLSKGRKALIIYGGLGHLQRRDVYRNFQPSPDRSAGVLELVERYRPGSTFNIWTNSATDDLGATQSEMALWKKPSLIILKGTTLGARDFTTVLYDKPPQNERRIKYLDGKTVPIGKDEFVKFKLEDNFDALLYLGPISSITLAPYPIDTYSDENYYRELVRRSKALNGFGLEEIENQRKKYLESRKDPK